MYEQFLRNVPLFADLPADDLVRLCRLVSEVRLAAGELLFAEGSLADRTYILQKGALEIVKSVDGREVLIDVQRVPGTIIGEMAMLEDTPRLATVRAIQDSLLLGLDHDRVHRLLSLSPTAAKIMLGTLARRWRALESQVRHSERMAQLGVLTAGVAHELNNPTAAVVRGASQLNVSLERSQAARIALERLDLSEEQKVSVNLLAERLDLARAARQPSYIVAMARSDREEALESWLELKGVPEGWRFAPTLVSLGLETEILERVVERFQPNELVTVLEWLEAAYSAQFLVQDIAEAAARISGIVTALKSYVYLDQAPVQDVDAHKGLDDSLIILQHKLTDQITVHKDYDLGLPKITAYGSELNQVWTCLIDNAIDALEGQGEIYIRTRRGDSGIVVEIEDNGRGIDPADLPKLFDPFFTTKPPGQGAGLGLSVCYNIITGKHHGNIRAIAEAGRTIFRVELPWAIAKDTAGEKHT
jgi:signal transduction histidine kinase